MEISYFVFLMLWIILFGLVIGSMRAMKTEMAFLPALPTNQDLKGPPQPSVGKNIRGILPAEFLNQPYSVVSVTLPTCSFCHSALEEFLELNKEAQLPFMDLLVMESKAEVKHFIDTFEEAIKIRTVSNEFVQSLGIDAFPTFLLINLNGEIIHESGWGRGVLMHYRKLLKKEGFSS